VELRSFGALGIDVPVVGLGTWNMEHDARETTIAAIRRALDLGMTHIDTAELYGSGMVEEIVGEAIAGYRAEVFLASKVNPDHATYAGTLLACEKSLRRLRTDRLDLYMLHWRGTQPLDETFRAFETLKKDGKIRSWGVSNFDVADLEEAIAIAGERVIACNQVLYSLDERDVEHVLALFCERHEIPLVAYSPLGAGAFPKAGSFKGDLLAGIGAAHGVSPFAVALRFLLQGPNVFTIPKSARVAHVEELARAGTLVLSAQEIASIDAAFALEAPKSKLPYV
jgi:diketogulonate reductase-like aldo/keto reductase